MGRQCSCGLYKPILTVLIRRFYLRTYFGACYGSHLNDVHGDLNLARTTLFSGATYYLKFHEAMCADLGGWRNFGGWIRETYWRLRAKGNSESLVPTGVVCDPPLVVGPNVYHGTAGREVRDLRMLPEEADEWGVDLRKRFVGDLIL